MSPISLAEIESLHGSAVSAIEATFPIEGGEKQRLLSAAKQVYQTAYLEYGHACLLQAAGAFTPEKVYDVAAATGVRTTSTSEINPVPQRFSDTKEGLVQKRDRISEDGENLWGIYAIKNELDDLESTRLGLVYLFEKNTALFGLGTADYRALLQTTMWLKNFEAEQAKKMAPLEEPVQ